jgi:hypothetical protein
MTTPAINYHQTDQAGAGAMRHPPVGERSCHLKLLGTYRAAPPHGGPLHGAEISSSSS